MSFDHVLASAFPGSLDEGAFVRSTAAALAPLGFRGEATLACVATCRDEICWSWAEAVAGVWGPPFSITGLGGLILAGRTGFGAALSHAPNADGRERYVFLAGPHVAIGPGGEPGVCERVGRSGTSTACGAIAAILKEVEAGRLGATDDPDDVELGQLRQRLGSRAPQANVRDLFDLTRLAHDVIAADLERTLADVVDTTRVDYAMATGIQIHAPDGKNRIQPRTFFACVGGERHEIRHASEASV